MNFTSKSSLSSVLNSFKSDNEEDGEIFTQQETEPKNFRADKELNSQQLSKFLEYYTEKSSGEYKYTKTQLNKINNIAHNHFHIISKDVKIFKLYKSLIQLVTQDMHEWIEKDFYCGDAILEILREVQSRREHSWYERVFRKLRLEEIINKQIEKAEGRRKKAEEDRINSKRARNWEKKQKKTQVLIDPYEFIKLPTKLPRAQTTHNTQIEEIFKKPCLIDTFEEPQTDFQKPEENFEEFQIHETEDWFSFTFNEKVQTTIEILPDTRPDPPSIDPRIEVHLKCRGLSYILENTMLHSKIEKFTIIINIKCLLYPIDLSQPCSLRNRIPKETRQLIYKDSEYLICFRPHWQTFLNSIQKIADVWIFSLLPDGLAELCLPGCKIITNKCVEFNKELTIILDNEKIGWKQELMVPVLYYDPLLIDEKLMISKRICNLRDKDMVQFCVKEGDGQLDGLSKMLYEVYAKFIENKFRFTAICEFRNAKKTILAGLNFGIKKYKERIGCCKGYCQVKFEAYCVAVDELGGNAVETGGLELVEEKKLDNEVSGMWVLGCLLNFKFLEKF